MPKKRHNYLITVMNYGVHVLFPDDCMIAVKNDIIAVNYHL